MLRFKIDVMDELKKRGYTTYKLRKDKLLGTRVITDIAKGEVPGVVSLGMICTLLECQPGDILENVKSDDETRKIEAKTGDGAEPGDRPD